MITTADIELARTIALDRFGSEARLEPLPASNHVVLRVSLPDGERVLKMAASDGDPESIRKETVLIDRVRCEGIPVPSIEAAGLDGERYGRPFFVMKSAGKTTVMDWAGESGQLPRMLFKEMGSILARVHGVTFPAGGDLGPAGVTRSGPSQLLGEIFSFAAWMVRQSLLEGADVALLESLEIPDTSGYALCHADFHAPQCVVDQGRIVAVVDWESAWVGNPAIDVAFTHNFLDTYCMLHGTSGLSRAVELRGCFFEGYRAVRALPDDYESAYLPVRMAHMLGAVRTWHQWGPEVWDVALADRVPRATALFRAYCRKVRARANA